MPSKDAICATSSRSDMVGAGSADGGGRVELVTTQVTTPRIAHGLAVLAGLTASLLRGAREWVFYRIQASTLLGIQAIWSYAETLRKYHHHGTPHLCVWCEGPSIAELRTVASQVACST